jgi:hypothetical protein
VRISLAKRRHGACFRLAPAGRSRRLPVQPSSPRQVMLRTRRRADSSFLQDGW